MSKNRAELAIGGVDLEVKFRSVADQIIIKEDNCAPECIFQRNAGAAVTITPKAILLTKQGVLLELFNTPKDSSQASYTKYLKTQRTPEELNGIFDVLGLRDMTLPVRKPTILDRIKFAMCMA